MIRASIVGGSGYSGGELIRLLHFHPEVEIAQVTSERLAGKFGVGPWGNPSSVMGLPSMSSGGVTPAQAARVGAMSIVATRVPLRPARIPGPMKISGTCRS